MSPTAPEHAAVVGYYRAVGPTLLDHLIGRRVVGFGAGPPQAGRGVELHIAGSADLDESVRSGVVGFRLPGSTGRGRLALWIRAGDDSGIDTVATTTLALMELMRADGVPTTAMLDGCGGLYLAGAGADQSAAADYARQLADAAPEIATTSPDQTAGRALIEPIPSDPGLPAPYSLVYGPDGLAVVAPLTRDEVAAATAGMPLEIDPSDLAERVRTHGDLARPLARASDG